MLVVVARVPSDPGAVARAAPRADLAAADLALRLRGILPRVVRVEADAGRARAAVDALVAEGFLAFLVDSAAVATDAERVRARTLEWTAEGFVALDAAGHPHPCPTSHLRLLQKGRRVRVDREESRVTERSFSMTRAVATGGLVLTRAHERTAVDTTESRTTCLLVQRGDGAPDVLVPEAGTDFRFLGARMEPSSHVNLERTLAALRERAPDVPFDDRAAQALFLGGLPAVGLDTLDLAFALVAAAHAHGA